MSILSKIRRNFELFRYFGLGSLNRFLHRRDPVTILSMKGVGRVHLRLANSDFAAFKQVFVGREYDLSAIGGARGRVDARYQAILDAGKTPIVIDAGANVGAASLWFARAFPQAAIVAVEPDPENARLLRLNTAGAPHVLIREAAIAGEHGRVALDNSRTPAWAGP
jgi:hypothetical protein